MVLSLSFLQTLESMMIGCPSQHYLGIRCPGCGMQRSILALLQGRVVESISLYPALIPILLMLIYLGLHLTYKYEHGAKRLVQIFITVSLIIVTSYVYKIIT